MFLGFIIGVVFPVLDACGAGYGRDHWRNSGQCGCQASAIERWVAGTSLRATMQKETPKGPNPFATTDGNDLRLQGARPRL